MLWMSRLCLLFKVQHVLQLVGSEDCSENDKSLCDVLFAYTKSFDLRTWLLALLLTTCLNPFSPRGLFLPWYLCPSFYTINSHSSRDIQLNQSQLIPPKIRGIEFFTHCQLIVCVYLVAQWTSSAQGGEVHVDVPTLRPSVSISAIVIIGNLVLRIDK